jgi:hypothetical protein
MNEHLRPLNLGEILDRTVQLYRARFLVFLGISVIPTGALVVVGAAAVVFFLWWGSNGPSSVSTAVAGLLAVLAVCVGILLVLPVILGLTALASAAMSHAANCIYHGETVTIRAAYKRAWQKGWRYIWLYLLETLAVWVAPVAVWIVLFAVSLGISALAVRAGMGASLGILIGFLAFLVIVALAGYALWMALRLCLAFPACVVEETTAWAAFKRSGALSKGTRGRVFLLYLLGLVLTWMLSTCVNLLLTIVIALIPGTSSPQHAQAAAVTMAFVSFGLMFSMQAFIKPVYGIALLVFYYDQRIRKEGYDIEWMMQKAGLVVPPPEAASQPESAAPPFEEPAGGDEVETAQPAVEEHQ